MYIYDRFLRRLACEGNKEEELKRSETAKEKPNTVPQIHSSGSSIASRPLCLCRHFLTVNIIYEK